MALLGCFHGVLLASAAFHSPAARSVVGSRRHALITNRAYTVLDADEVAARTARVLAVKEASGKSFDEIATELGYDPNASVHLRPVTRLQVLFLYRT